MSGHASLQETSEEKKPRQENKLSKKFKSSIDGKNIVSLEDELFKLRRYFRGKEKEFHNFRRKWEKTKAVTSDKDSKDYLTYLENRIRVEREEEGNWGFHADIIDAVLQSMNVSIPEKYLLKSELVMKIPEEVAS